MTKSLMNQIEEKKEISETSKWITKSKENIQNQEKNIEILVNFFNDSKKIQKHKIIKATCPQEANGPESIECTLSQEQIKVGIDKLKTNATILNNYKNKVDLMICKKRYSSKLIKKLSESKFNPTEKKKYEKNFEEFLESYKELCKKRSNSKIIRHKKNIYVHEEKLIEHIDRIFNSRADNVKANLLANDLFSSDLN